MKLVITGASGYVAGRMLDALRERYDLTLLDVKSTDRQGNKIPGIVVTDLLDENRDNYRKHFQGTDAVLALIHAKLFHISPAFSIAQCLSQESRSDLLVCGRIWQQITCQLLDCKLIEPHVTVQRVNNPLTKPPGHRPQLVSEIAVAICVCLLYTSTSPRD